jgi:hypothetical protein
MRKVQETDTELYIEIDIEDLPLTINNPSKTLYVSLAPKGKSDEELLNE